MQSYMQSLDICVWAASQQQSAGIVEKDRKGLSIPLVDMADCVIGVWQFSPDVKTGKIQTLLSGLAWKPPRISSGWKYYIFPRLESNECRTHLFPRFALALPCGIWRVTNRSC